MIQIIHDPLDFKRWRKGISGKSIGFVPTMGALHSGHGELLKKARQENDLVVLSIFVNPTQFNDPNDFTKYPVTWADDLALAEKNQVDVLFAPNKEFMYPDNYSYKVIETRFSPLLCGKDRPGHFDGVLSVVMKLFNVVQSDRAYFGEKDFQQLELIKGMVAAFFMDVAIVSVPTVREISGLALSSRNARLNELERRELAPLIYKYISSTFTPNEIREKLESSGFKVDYVIDYNGRRFIAAYLGEVRLIDNVAI